MGYMLSVVGESTNEIITYLDDTSLGAPPQLQINQIPHEAAPRVTAALGVCSLVR